MRFKDEKDRGLSQFKIITRAMISSPPIHAALLVIEILSNEALRTQWFQETKLMADRIKSMRTQLKTNLETAGSKRNWSHITSQIGTLTIPHVLIIGMFCFSGLTPEQVDTLKTEYNIFLTKDGRISMAGGKYEKVGVFSPAIRPPTK